MFFDSGASIPPGVNWESLTIRESQEDTEGHIARAKDGEQRATLKADNATIPHQTVPKRRAHKKSRLGCVNCKKRKVKCQETWPSCANCIRLGCSCRYPTLFKHTHHDRITSEMPISPPRYTQVSKRPLSHYNANDMRLFHHFMVAAHPSTPHKYEAIWISDIPALSYQYDYLMHAMLALAGSHLDMYSEHPRQNIALGHRQKAIAGLGAALDRWPSQPKEAHVMLATSCLLTYQAFFIPDGMQDYVISLRGCGTISRLIATNKIEGAFTANPNPLEIYTEWKTDNFPTLDQGLIVDASHSLLRLAPYLESPKSSDIERAVILQMIKCLRPLLVPVCEPGSSSVPTIDLIDSYVQVLSEPTRCSRPTEYKSTSLVEKSPFPPESALISEDTLSKDAITQIPSNPMPYPQDSLSALVENIKILTEWPYDQVMHLMSPLNTIGNVVMAHFACVRFVLAPLAVPDSARKMPIRALIEMYEKIVDTVDDDKEVRGTNLIEWPRKISRALRSSVNEDPTLTLHGLCDIIINYPAKFCEDGLSDYEMGSSSVTGNSNP